MQKALSSLSGLIAVLVLFVVMNSAYTIHETEQAIITQFGKPVGDPVTSAGLHFKIPFVQQVNPIERRILAWDGQPNEMPTKDKTYIEVDTFARWRIMDAKQYFLRLRDERSAQSRLDDILGSETRNAIAKHELIEIVRTTKDRESVVDETLVDDSSSLGQLYPITKGRALIEQEIFEQAEGKLTDFGIELLDIRFKRINYNETVRKEIYARMISERQQIAERFRSEGAGEAARILGNKEKDLQEIEHINKSNIPITRLRLHPTESLLCDESIKIINDVYKKDFTRFDYEFKNISNIEEHEHRLNARSY